MASVSLFVANSTTTFNTFKDKLNETISAHNGTDTSLITLTANVANVNDNITTLYTSISTVNTALVANVAMLQTNITTVNTALVANVAMLQTNITTVNTALVANVATINTALSGKQPLDAQLTGIASTTPAADTYHYWTDSSTAVVATITAQGRSLVAGANAAAQRVTMGVDVELAKLDAAAVAYAIALG